jgi:hypothetical protein
MGAIPRMFRESVPGCVCGSADRSPSRVIPFAFVPPVGKRAMPQG